MLVLGTRPEAIKLLPLIDELKDRGKPPLILNTGQHSPDMLGLSLVAHESSVINLSSMNPGSKLTDLYADLIGSCGSVMSETQPSSVIVHGDTASSTCAAWAAFLMSIPVIHVEAGLRTYNPASPFPEEMNRRVTAQLAQHHFAATELNKLNLMREGVPAKSISVVGNTIVDSTRKFYELNLIGPKRDSLLEYLNSLVDFDITVEPYALITLHRRENADAFQEMLATFSRLAHDNPSFNFVFPVHPNPLIREVAHGQLSQIKNVSLLPPLSYEHFLGLLSFATFLASDSGGVQEEAVTLSKSLFILRRDTERPEALTVPGIRLVGTDSAEIAKSLAKSISAAGNSLPNLNLELNPFGSGHTSSLIADYLDKA